MGGNKLKQNIVCFCNNDDDNNTINSFNDSINGRQSILAAASKLSASVLLKFTYPVAMTQPKRMRGQQFGLDSPTAIKLPSLTVMHPCPLPHPTVFGTRGRGISADEQRNYEPMRVDDNTCADAHRQRRPHACTQVNIHIEKKAARHILSVLVV